MAMANSDSKPLTVSKTLKMLTALITPIVLKESKILTSGGNCRVSVRLPQGQRC